MNQLDINFCGGKNEYCNEQSVPNNVYCMISDIIGGHQVVVTNNISQKFRMVVVSRVKATKRMSSQLNVQ